MRRRDAVIGQLKGAAMIDLEPKSRRSTVQAITLSIVQESSNLAWREKWVTRKLGLIERFGKDADMSEYDAHILIVGSIIGALAAELWPGKYKDRQRFVELLVAYVDPVFGTKTISVPLLKAFLLEKGWVPEAKALGERWCESDECDFMLGIERDADEFEITTICPNVPRSFIRQFSYANLLYDEVQLGRECAHGRTKGIPPNEVGYTRRPETRRWSIYFGSDWLRALVVSAEELSRVARVEKSFARWWLS